VDGTLDLSSTMNYQFRIPNSNVFGIFGIAAGFYNIDNSAESYVWPVLSFEYRI